jgi:hypothetical protein
MLPNLRIYDSISQVKSHPIFIYKIFLYFAPHCMLLKNICCNCYNESIYKKKIYIIFNAKQRKPHTHLSIRFIEVIYIM